MQSQLDCFSFEIKKGMIQDVTFIHLIWNKQKRINFEKITQKQREAETEPGYKRILYYTLDINFIALIDRDYELIRRSKTTITLLHDSQINLSEK